MLFASSRSYHELFPHLWYYLIHFAMYDFFPICSWPIRIFQFAGFFLLCLLTASEFPLVTKLSIFDGMLEWSILKIKWKFLSAVVTSKYP